MFKYRVIGFVLLVSLLCGIFFWSAGGGWLFLAAAPAMSALAMLECALMLDRSGRRNWPYPVAGVYYIIILSWCCCRMFALPLCWLALFGALVSFGGFALILALREKVLDKMLNTLGILALLLPGFLLLLDSYYCEKAKVPCGIWLLFLCLVTKATDTGGYIVGSLTAKLPGGNHKIAPNVSPKKSYEGLAGGIVLSLAVSICFYLTDLFFAVPLWWFVFSGAVLAMGSFFGDLAESAVKRLCGVKDSGSWVPGMGGAFDVLDSFIFNGILFTLLLLLI